METASTVVPSEEVTQQLAALFLRNGYVRRFNPKLKKALARKYKKGDEVRLVAGSKAELRTMRRLLRAAGFTPGRPHAKAKQWRQPIYGRTEVARFLRLIREGVREDDSEGSK